MNKIRKIVVSFVFFILVIIFSLNTVIHNHALTYQFHDNCPACVLSITFHAPDIRLGSIFQTENPQYKLLVFNFEEQGYYEDVTFFYLNKAPPVC